MTTQAQRFAKLLNKGFQVIHNDVDEDNYILLPDRTNDNYLLFDIEGDKMLCEYCNKQLFYQDGNMSCENPKCELS